MADVDECLREFNVRIPAAAAEMIEMSLRNLVADYMKRAGQMRRPADAKDLLDEAQAIEDVRACIQQAMVDRGLWCPW